MSATHDCPARVHPERLAALHARENAAFRARIPHSLRLQERARRHMPHGVPMAWMAGLWRTPPVYVAHGAGPRFTDVDGNAYLDFNLCDLSMTVGYGHPAVARAAARQCALGTHFLAPTEDAVVVSEHLAERVGLPHWQYTLSASNANTEVIRIARFLTGRPRVVIFAGHYHGHIEETLVRAENGVSVPDTAGLSPGSAAHTTVLPFNDAAALERTLARGDVALVLTEPAMTNCNLILPQPGFHAALRELTRRHGTLLCIDEAHTFQFAYGGLSRAWQLAADFVVTGKGFGSGVAFAAYGLSEPIAEAVARHIDLETGPRGIALGGTTYGSALALAVARVMLEEVLTPAAQDHANALGTRLADGLERLFAARDLPWRAFRCGPRAGYCLAPTLPVHGAEAYRSIVYPFIDARRVYLANRGIWDAVASAGPQASLAHTPADIDTYLDAAASFLDEVVDG